MDVENIPEFNITIPSLQLFKHQKQYCTLLNLIQDKHAVYKYIENEKYYIRSDFFILDSRVGSGKTISVLLYLHSNIGKSVIKTECLHRFQHYGNIKIMKENYLKSNSDLILVPHTVYAQWVHEIKDFFPHLAKRLVCIDTQKKACMFVKAADDVLYLVKDTMAVYLNFNKHVFFRNFIVDEPHIIKPMKFMQFNYNLMLWLCATPKALMRKRNAFICRYFQNNHAYYIHYPMELELKLANCIGFPETYIDKCMPLQPYKNTIIKCRESETLHEIYKYLPVETAFYFFSNDTTRLQFTHEKTAIQVVLLKYRIQIYELSARINYVISNENLNQEEKNERRVDMENKIVNLQHKIDSINNIINSMSQNDCAVCLEPITMSKSLLPCGHLFCTMCVLSLQQQKCPLCRNVFVLSEVNHVKLEKHRDKKTNLVCLPQEPSHKLLELLRLCKQIKENFIIAVRCHKFAQKIQYFLSEQGFKITQLHGQTCTIEKKKKQLQDNKIKGLVLSDSKSCSGMNLQFINHVIIFSKMKESKKKQIIGRAWRPGRKETLNVYELLYPYEEEQVAADYV